MKYLAGCGWFLGFSITFVFGIICEVLQYPIEFGAWLCSHCYTYMELGVWNRPEQKWEPINYNKPKPYEPNKIDPT
jgi:hypothetical protein